jgi:cytochrome P450
MYFGGHETTAITATWCLMLLATHPEWQDRARAEALDVCCGDTAIDFDVLRRLKTVRNHLIISLCTHQSSSTITPLA